MIKLDCTTKRDMFTKRVKWLEVFRKRANEYKRLSMDMPRLASNAASTNCVWWLPHGIQAINVELALLINRCAKSLSFE